MNEGECGFESKGKRAILYLWETLIYKPHMIRISLKITL